jgi:hypothetical protein
VNLPPDSRSNDRSNWRTSSATPQRGALAGVDGPADLCAVALLRQVEAAKFSTTMHHQILPQLRSSRHLSENSNRPATGCLPARASPRNWKLKISRTSPARLKSIVIKKFCICPIKKITPGSV